MIKYNSEVLLVLLYCFSFCTFTYSNRQRATLALFRSHVSVRCHQCWAGNAQRIHNNCFRRKKTSACCVWKRGWWKRRCGPEQTISESSHITRSHLIPSLYKQTVECSCREFNQLAEEQIDLVARLQHKRFNWEWHIRRDETVSWLTDSWSHSEVINNFDDRLII